MSKPTGRRIALSPFRQTVDDLLSFSVGVPFVTADRRMDLAPLAAARAASATRPAWVAIFARAYGLLSRDHPPLRQSYMKFPWAHLYEHPHSVASINVERRLPDEDIILQCLIRAPENRGLDEIDAIVREHKNAPVESLRVYNRAVTLSRVPWPFRQLVWWATLNVFGKVRCHNFGTFGLTSVASQGAGLVCLAPLLTSSLHYGLFDGTRLDCRVSWDHRVFDGATAARALADFEGILNREMVRELTGQRAAAA